MKLIQAFLLMILIINITFIIRPSVLTFGGKLIVYTSAYSTLSALSYPVYLLMFVFYCNSFLKKGVGKSFVIYFSALALITIVSSFSLEIIERIKYPNYVYSNFHIYIPALVGFSYIQLFVFVCGVYFLFGKFFRWIKPESILSWNNIIIFLLIATVYGTVVKLPSFASDEYIQQRNNYSMKSLDIRYRTTDLPQLSRQLLFIRSKTPDDAVIIHPPQSVDFPDVGNQVLLRYYLYPRTLVTYKLLNQYLNDKSKETCNMYTLISRSGSDKEYIFPNVTSLPVKNATVLNYDGTIVNMDLKTFNNASLVKENFLIGVLENKQCSIF